MTFVLIRLNMPTLLPAFPKTYFTWAVQERDSSNTTPRYLNSDTRSIKISRDINGGLLQCSAYSLFQRVHTLFSTYLAKRLLSLSQLSTNWRSQQSVFSISFTSLLEWKRTVSSAYWSMCCRYYSIFQSFTTLTRREILSRDFFRVVNWAL